MSGCAAAAFFASATSARRRFELRRPARSCRRAASESFSSFSRSAASSFCSWSAVCLVIGAVFGSSAADRTRAPALACAARVGVGEPVADMEQLARPRRARQSPAWRGGCAPPGCRACDHPRLVEHRLARGRPEGRLVDQGAQVVLIWEPERRVVLVRPGDRQLQSAAGVEARRSRVGVDRRLGPRCGLEDLRPLVPEESELAHVSFLDTARPGPFGRLGTARMRPGESTRRSHLGDRHPAAARPIACHAAIQESQTRSRTDS